MVVIPDDDTRRGPISEELYQFLALVDHAARWELQYGRLRAKPAGTWQYTSVLSELLFSIRSQLNRREYSYRMNAGRVRRTSQHYYIPDAMFIPRRLTEVLRAAPGSFEVYDDPLPLIVDVWSDPIPEYDWFPEERIRQFKLRGDLEIWLVHPYEHWLSAWRRQADGTYTETRYDGGVVRPASLPGVAIDLDELFED